MTDATLTTMTDMTFSIADIGDHPDGTYSFSLLAASTERLYVTA